MKKTVITLGVVCLGIIAAALPPLPGMDREPAFLKEFPYTPADGEVLSVNPSAFSFLPPSDWELGKYHYCVEYSQNASFQPSQKITGLDRCMVIPQQPLAPGQWFWRYGVELPKGVAWSKTRTFRVPENIPTQPFPDLKQAAAKIPATHPRLYVRPEMVAEIRRRAASGDLVGMTRKLSDDLRPKINAPLVAEPPFLPKKPWGSPEFMKAYTDIFRSVRPDQRAMYDFGLLYLLTGDQIHGLEAKRRIMHFFVKWNPQGSTALRHNDEPARTMLLWGLPAYTWTADLFTPEERAAVEKSIRVRARQMYDYLRRKPMDVNPYESHSNSFLIYLANACMVLLPEHPEMLPELEYALTVFSTATPVWGKADGGWNEGAAYWAYYMDPIMGLLFSMRNICGVELGAKPFFRNTGYYPLIGWPGRSRQSSFGDGSHASAQADLLRVLAFYNHNPDFLKAIRDRKQPVTPDIWAVLCDDSQMPAPDLSRLPKSWYFPGIGFVAMRTDLNNFSNDVGLLFQSNPYGAVSHHHCSQNCILLEVYGEPVAISSGYYDNYMSPHHGGWTRQTKAKNGITYDGGKGQLAGPEAAGKIIRFETNDKYDIAVSDAAKAYPELTRAERAVVHVRPGIFVIRDVCEGPEEHQFEYNLHSWDPGRFDEAAQTATLYGSRVKVGAVFRFFAEKPLKFREFTKFPIPPYYEKPRPDQWHMVASTAEKSRRFDLITVLLPFHPNGEKTVPQVEKIPGGVRIIRPNAPAVDVRFEPEISVTETATTK